MTSQDDEGQFSWKGFIKSRYNMQKLIFDLAIKEDDGVF